LNNMCKPEIVAQKNRYRLYCFNRASTFV